MDRFKYIPFIKLLDIFSEMNPLFWIMRVHGLFPYVLYGNNCRRLKLSKFWLSYSVIILLLKVLSVPLWVRAASSENTFPSTVGKLIKSIYFVSSCLSSCCMFLNIIPNDKEWSLLFSKLSEFDDISHYHVEYWRGLLTTLLLICFTFLIAVFGLYYIYTNILFDPFLLILTCFQDYLVKVLMLSQSSFLLRTTSMLKERFEHLNSVLVVEMDHCQENKRIVAKKTNNGHGDKCAIAVCDVNNVMCSRDLLCDACDIISSWYSFRLLFSTAIKFLAILIYSYYIVATFSEDLILGGAPSSMIVNSVFVIGPLVMLFRILHTCNSASYEANRTAVLVHKLMNKTKDPKVREELELFSLQLLHRKVQFTACGFFPLDFTLLYSIVGAVTTYLVILIQFQLSFKNSHPASENSTQST